MSPDVYGAWRTAGDNLQPVAAWLAAHWTGLLAYGLAAAVLTVAIWALWPTGSDYRTRNDQRAARTAALEPRPEPDQPGVDDTLLAACQQICPELARKETES